MGLQNKPDIETIVSSIAAGIGKDYFVADTSVLLACTTCRIYDYSDISQLIAEKRALFYERMLAVLGMDNLILPGGVKGELKMLLFGIRIKIDESKVPHIRRLERSAAMMHRVLCHKPKYVPTDNYLDIIHKLECSRLNPQNYEHSEQCSKEDLQGIATTLDLACAKKTPVGLFSKDGYQVELMARVARELEIPVELLIYDSSTACYKRRNYSKLGEWDVSTKTFTRLE